MADIITRNGKTGRNSKSLRVDLTPMVDLGFLLITFFVFTTTMSETMALNLAMPKDDEKGTNVPASGAFTILPSADKIFYYEGLLPDVKQQLASIDYNDVNELRVKLLQLKKTLVAQNGNDDKLVVMIKPTAAANFSNVVDMLDEMTICAVKRYALVEPDQQEKKLLPY